MPTGGRPGLNGTGGAPNAGEGLRGGGAGGPGVGPRTAGGRPGGGANPEDGLRCDGGLTERERQVYKTKCTFVFNKVVKRLKTLLDMTFVINEIKLLRS